MRFSVCGSFTQASELRSTLFDLRALRLNRLAGSFADYACEFWHRLAPRKLISDRENGTSMIWLD